ncbi:MAG: hypothetical protein RL681_56 [Candidatus Parcubacteria bacterium]
MRQHLRSSRTTLAKSWSNGNNCGIRSPARSSPDLQSGPRHHRLECDEISGQHPAASFYSTTLTRSNSNPSSPCPASSDAPGNREVAMTKHLRTAASVACGILFILTLSACGGGGKGPTDPGQPGPVPTTPTPSPTPNCPETRTRDWSLISSGEAGSIGMSQATRAVGMVFHVNLEWTPQPPGADVQLYLYNYSSPPDACPPSQDTCWPGLSDSTAPGVHPREVSYVLKAADERLFIYVRNRSQKDAMYRLTWSFCNP